MEIIYAIEQFRLADTIVHRDTILQVLVEKFCGYFVAAAEGYVHLILPTSSLKGAEMAGWSQEKTCEVLEAAISKIADHRDEIGKKDVNNNTRVATIDKDNGFRWVRDEAVRGVPDRN